MCILDTTRYPRFANVARKPRYPEGKALERDRPLNLNIKKSLADCSTSD